MNESIIILCWLVILGIAIIRIVLYKPKFISGLFFAKTEEDIYLSILVDNIEKIEIK